MLLCNVALLQASGNESVRRLTSIVELAESKDIRKMILYISNNEIKAGKDQFNRKETNILHNIQELKNLQQNDSFTRNDRITKLLPLLHSGFDDEECLDIYCDLNPNHSTFSQKPEISAADADAMVIRACNKLNVLFNKSLESLKQSPEFVYFTLEQEITEREAVIKYAEEK